jgi:hypothetical protein
MSPPQAPPGVPAAIINDLNAGVGFVNYAGHGNSNSWACVGLSSGNLASLNNSDRLPVAFAAACDTGGLAHLAPFGPYVDVAGQVHCGTSNGETLPPGPYPHVTLPRPGPLQSGAITCPGAFCINCQLDPPCLAETFLFGNPIGSTGAIAYLGARSGSRPQQSIDLDRHFFRAYEKGYFVLGDIWKDMMAEYYKQHGLANSHTWFRAPSDWEIGHTFDEPQKYILFGDPSLVVGGGVHHQ